MFEQIVEIISMYSDVNVEEIDEHVHFVHDLGINSLDMINIVSALEDKYHIDIPLEEVMQFRQLNQIIEYVKNKSVNYL